MKAQMFALSWLLSPIPPPLPRCWPASAVTACTKLPRQHHILLRRPDFALAVEPAAVAAGQRAVDTAAAAVLDRLEADLLLLGADLHIVVGI
jgi:hypothetical protein